MKRIVNTTCPIAYNSNSCFVLSNNDPQSSHSVANPSQAQQVPKVNTLPSSKVLVVEDDAISQRVAQLILAKIGYSVDIAANGQAALNFYNTHQYAAILMDIGLPDMQGTEVCLQIRKLEKKRNNRVPIIALTAHTEIMAKKLCLNAGMDDFLMKPIDIEQLAQLLTMWIAKPD